MSVPRRDTAFCLALGLIALAGGLAAQIARSKEPPKEPSANVFAAMERGPHYGEPEEALVGVEVTNVTSGRSRRAAGLVLRCDGFVLCPSSLFALQEGEKRSDEFRVTVILQPGTESEKRVAGRFPQFTAPGLGFTVFKVDDVHWKAARINLPDTIEAGDSLELITLPWDSGAKRFRQFKPRRASIAEQPREPLSPLAGDVLLKPSGEPIPPGAILLNPDRRVVGMVVTDSEPRFLSFEYLNDATNCVAPSPRKPLPASDPPAGGEEAKPGIEGGDMVRVPGGPVRIPRMLAAEQPDLEGAAVACIGDFEIDKYEVTNEQYREFWKSLPEPERKDRKVREKLYPFSWAEDDTPYPAEVSHHPVVGVSTTGAAAYARWKGKRLPTPYEWSLSAFGPKGEAAPPKWVQEYASSRQETWEQIKAAHARFLSTNQALFQQEMNPPRDPKFRRRKMPGVYAIPWIVSDPACVSASTFSRQVFDNVLTGLESRWTDVSKLLDPGSRPFDKGPFGAMDMSLNAQELLVPWPGGSDLQRNMLYFTTQWLSPDLPGIDQWVPLWNPPGRFERASPLTYKSLSRLWTRYGQPPQRGEVPLDTTSALLNVSSAVEEAWPITGWLVRIGHGQSIPDGATGYWRYPLEHPLFPPGGRVWAGRPRGYRRELGREIPDITPIRSSYRQSGPSYSFKYESRPDNEFLLPVGFRCAR